MESRLTEGKDLEGNKVFYKCDFRLPSGSFKWREAFMAHALYGASSIDRVILASSGNTAMAFEQLRVMYKWPQYLDTFIWGRNGETRSTATAYAQDCVIDNDPQTSLCLIGKHNPIKMLAHQQMARETYRQYLELTGKPPLTYVQTTGSGYGCDAVEAVWKEPYTIRVQVASNLDHRQWAPAIVDAPSAADNGNCSIVVASDIKTAWPHLAEMVDCSIGLECAIALAGWQNYLNAYWVDKDKMLETPPVINLTGQLRGPLPW
jgi:threonine synthase